MSDDSCTVHYYTGGGSENGDFRKKLIWMIVGIVLVLAGVITLFFNDASVSVLDAVRSASELTAGADGKLNGDAVWVEGELNSENRATDTYINVSDCVVLRRYAEVYKRVEEQDTDSDGNTTYSTSYKWESNGTYRIVANGLKIGEYSIADGISMEFEDMPYMKVSAHAAVGHSVGYNCVYPSANRGSVSSPSVGDVRYSYRFLSNGAAGTVVARYSGNSLVRLDYTGFPAGVSVYKYYYNRTFDGVIAELEKSDAIRIWILRAVGTIVVLGGLLAVFLNFLTGKGINSAFQNMHIAVRIMLSVVIASAYSAAVILLASFYKEALALVGVILITLAALIPFIVILCMRRNPRKPDRYNRRA